MTKRDDFNRLRPQFREQLSDHCQNCGSVDDLIVHHIVPLAVGGNNVALNMAVLCGCCHDKIHGMSPDADISTRALARHARTSKASKGGYAGGVPPLGYVAERGTGRLTIDSEKAVVVREAFAFRDMGMSPTKVADTLNENGYTTREGKRFSAMTVKRIIDNEEFYRGHYVYDKRSGDVKVVKDAAHEAIL